MQQKSYYRTFNLSYVYFLVLVGVLSFGVFVILDYIQPAVVTVTLFIVLALSSYLYFSNGRITLDENGLQIGRRFIPKDKIISIQIKDEFIFKIGWETFLTIRYRYGNIEGTDIGIQLSSYTRDFEIEDSLRKWCSEYNIKYERKGKII